MLVRAHRHRPVGQFDLEAEALLVLVGRTIADVLIDVSHAKVGRLTVAAKANPANF